MKIICNISKIINNQYFSNITFQSRIHVLIIKAEVIIMVQMFVQDILDDSLVLSERRFLKFIQFKCKRYLKMVLDLGKDIKMTNSMLELSV